MRKLTSIFLFLFLAAGFLSTFSTSAAADDDPPGRVARLNYIQGSVSFQPGGETDWVQANPNRPLTTGDNLWADRNSRGELHINSTAIRMSNETGISFLNLDDRTVQIQLAQGSLNVHVRRLDGGDAFEIDTQNIAFTLERPGEYRVDVDPNGNSTLITVLEGEGEATGGGSNYHLDTGDSTRFSGTDTLTYDEGQAGRPDAFDDWCRSRDDREEQAQSARYVSRDVIGYEDLDDYGEWRSVPEYGYAWFPARVAPGWAPYHFGHWVWIEPWGWTWVEDEPWGFAPFHYGRWAVVGGGWCWVPGPRVVRPVYAPALVAFVGGSRFSISLSIGGGGVAWFPLGPREVYVPSRRYSERYVQNVNVTNTTVNVINVTNVYNNVNVTNINYMHRNNVNAVTAVSRDTFVNARPVGRSNVRVKPEQLREAEIQRGSSIAPVRRSVVGAGTPSNARPPEPFTRHQVIVKQPPAAPAVPFERRQQVVPAQPGRGPVQPQVDQGRRPQEQQPPNVKIAPPVQANQNASQPGHVATPQQVAPAQPGRGPAQPQADQGRRPRDQHGTPVKIAPAVQGSGNSSQPGRAPSQPQVVPSQPGRSPAQPQADQGRRSQDQQQPNVKFAPPARANEDTYHPHQFEKPQNVAPPKNEKQPEKEPARGQEQAQPHGQESSRPNSGDQERKQH